MQQQKEGKERIKTDEKCKGLLDRFVVVSVGTGEPTEESAAASTQVVDSSHAHKQMCHTQNSSFVKMRLINTCFRTFIFLSRDFFFMSLK